MGQGANVALTRGRPVFIYVVGVLLVLAWTDGRDGGPADAGAETTVEVQR